MGETFLKRLDDESKQYLEEIGQKVTEGKIKIDDIIGFKFPKVRAFVPDACSVSLTSLFSLLPLYDSIIYPIFDNMRKVPEGFKINTIEKFKLIHKATPDEISQSAMKGRVIPYFVNNFSEYDYKIIEPILEPGVPIINNIQIGLIHRYGLCKFTNFECKKCEELMNLGKKEYPKMSKGCVPCLGIFYQYGYNKENLMIGTSSDKDLFIPQLCFSKNVLISRNLDAVYSTQCDIGKDALRIVSNMPDPETLDYISKGLKINYQDDIPLLTYIDLLDNRTTKAIRKTIEDIMKDPYSKKNRQRLNARIFEYNQEIEKFANSKSAKFYQAVADLTVYGGSKFAEETSQRYVKLDDKSKTSLSKWIAERTMDIHAKITGKDWTIAQLYKLKCGLENCRNNVC